MKDTQLYIADQLVDLDGESLITMTYTLEDTDNPTIVKNSFSKSITLPATERNNALFGGIYDLTRITIPDVNKMSGVCFNSLKRTTFKLYIESELVESGYIQLTAITKTNGVARYTIQAYGGLGDFLYNLMYTEEGDKRNLASLNYNIEGYSGEHDNEMDFTINRDIVGEAWNNLPPSGRNSLSEVISFVPAYNGVLKDFDAQHALINYSDIATMNIPRTIKDESGKEYTSLNGYGKVEFKRSLDEAETHDLRSYLQRPALSMRALVEACCNPDNNGGYSVNLDPSFFTEENTLYHDAYVTLPMMSTEVESDTGVNTISITTPVTAYIGGKDNKISASIDMGRLSISRAPTNTTIKVNVPLSMKIGRRDYAELYTSIEGYHPLQGNVEYTYVRHNTAIVAQIVATDSANGNLLAASPLVALSSNGTFNTSWAVFTPYDREDRGVVDVKGSFVRKDNEMHFIDDKDNNTFPITLSFIRGNVTGVAISLRIQRCYEFVLKGMSDAPNMLFNSRVFNEVEQLGTIHTLASHYVTGNKMSAVADGSEVTTSTANLPSISSGSKVTKEILLGGTESPADYLLSYAKLFGLRFIKDVDAKVITITRDYFSGKTIDLNGRIDRSQAMTITPNVFSKKFMRMALDQPDTYFSTKYRDAHKVDYGQKRVDTGYSFNTDTEDIYGGNVFTSAVPCLAASKLFNTFKNAKSVEVFAPLADDVTLTLANGSDAAGYTTYSKVLPSADLIDPAKTTPFNVVKGYDLAPRMCYFDMADDVRESVDIANNLVIYCEKKALVNSANEEVFYWLTDDVPEMQKLNEKPCYLLTQSHADTSGNEIATRVRNLPIFLSMRLLNGIVRESFDFAKSKESYIPNINYPDGIALYDKYWSAIYADRMDVDTKRVTCMVNLSGLQVNGEALRHFYYFDGCNWLLNKVEDYDPSTNRLTKCEFIKVKDKGAYFNPSTLATQAVDVDVE